MLWCAWLRTYPSVCTGVLRVFYHMPEVEISAKQWNYVHYSAFKFYLSLWKQHSMSIHKHTPALQCLKSRQHGKTVLRAVCCLFISLKSAYKQWHPSKKPTLACIADMSSNTTNSLFLYFRWYQLYSKEVKSGISFCFMQIENLSTGHLLL